MDHLSISKQKDNKGNNKYQDIFNKSVESASAGATSMSLHVIFLMWIRTTMNYQYRHGGNFRSILSTLFHEPDIFRLYRGFVPGLLLGPLYRFGDVAANSIAMNASKKSVQLSKFPIFAQTAFGSVIAGFWRAIILPINAWKVSKQVHGKDGLDILFKKTKQYGVSALYQGSIAEILSTSVGHYSWFVLHNYLQVWLPKYSYKHEFSNAVLRSALVGFLSTLGTDILVNSFRVAKTFKQTVSKNQSYSQVFQQIIKIDGVSGIFFRGLLTKIFLNSIQGTSLTVSWKLMEYRSKARFNKDNE